MAKDFIREYTGLSKREQKAIVIAFKTVAKGYKFGKGKYTKHKENRIRSKQELDKEIARLREKMREKKDV